MKKIKAEHLYEALTNYLWMMRLIDANQTVNYIKETPLGMWGYSTEEVDGKET